MAVSAPIAKQSLEKLSEKGRRVLQRSPTSHPKALFVLRISAKFTLGAVLEPLFGQFQKGCSAKFEQSPGGRVVCVLLGEARERGNAMQALIYHGPGAK